MTDGAFCAWLLECVSLPTGQERRALTESGEVRNRAEIARREGITGARVTQIMALLRLARDIQQDIFALPCTAERPAVSERVLRPITLVEDLDDQRLRFRRLLAHRYERASLILTSNKSFLDWGEIFNDRVLATAILDRLLHHATTINIKGESFRLKDKRKRGSCEEPYPSSPRNWRSHKRPDRPRPQGTL